MDSTTLTPFVRESGGVATVSVTVDASSADAASPAWLPLAVALATADGVRTAASLPVEVEWPAQLTVPGGMCGGSAGSRELGQVDVSELPNAAAFTVTATIRVDVPALSLASGQTSITASGGVADRERLASDIVEQIRRRVLQWRHGDPALAVDYRARCATVGRLTPEGVITGIDSDGRLLIDP